jgi:hypothetical protein
MSDTGESPVGDGIAANPEWPAGFWEELKRMPLPEDFDIGEPLEDNPDRYADWVDSPRWDE